MADLSFLKTLSKPVAVFGLGITGSAVAEALQQANVPFNAWDEFPETRELYKDKFPLKDFTNALQDYAFFVRPAGIKPAHPINQKVAAAGIPVYSDVDLLLQSAPDATVIGITGTNGKSTTTALIGHILGEAGLKFAVGGNIGKGACSLPSLDKDGIYVLELSSYMLEITAQPIADIAVLLNITPDHFEWHGTLENYTASKEKIFRQREGRKPQIKIYGTTMHRSTPVIPELPEHPFLKGVHNLENITAAFEACRACGLDDATIIKHLMTFKGLNHRQMNVGTYQQIQFINDSKATNADATSKALASYNDIYWIVGGQPKSDGLNGLDIYYPKIKQAYLIGEASDAFADVLNGQVAFQKCGTIANAVKSAFNDAKQANEKATILLSPACASFDQYKNFEQRGDDFAAQVATLLKGEKA